MTRMIVCLLLVVLSVGTVQARHAPPPRTGWVTVTLADGALDVVVASVLVPR